MTELNNCFWHNLPLEYVCNLILLGKVNYVTKEATCISKCDKDDYACVCNFVIFTAINLAGVILNKLTECCYIPPLSLFHLEQEVDQNITDLYSFQFAGLNKLYNELAEYVF